MNTIKVVEGKDLRRRREAMCEGKNWLRGRVGGGARDGTREVMHNRVE